MNRPPNGAPHPPQPSAASGPIGSTFPPEPIPLLNPEALLKKQAQQHPAHVLGAMIGLAVLIMAIAFVLGVSGAVLIESFHWARGVLGE